MLYVVLIVLAIVQGLAEFLPISSSGHLVIFQNIPLFKQTLATVGSDVNLLIDTALHVATLVAVVIFLWKDIVRIVTGFFKGVFTREWNSDVSTAIYIAIASIPAGLAGFLLEDFFDRIFSSIISVFVFLIINGFMLLSTKLIPIKGRKISEIGPLKAILVGCFQAIAILPGISRSGATITGGLINGLEPEESARFSFLMAIPVIAGAGLFQALKLDTNGLNASFYSPMLVSMLVATIVALLSLKLLFWLVKKVRLDIFGYYTIAVGIIGLVVIFLLK